MKTTIVLTGEEVVAIIRNHVAKKFVRNQVDPILKLTTDRNGTAIDKVTLTFTVNAENEDCPFG